MRLIVKYIFLTVVAGLLLPHIDTQAQGIIPMPGDPTVSPPPDTARSRAVVSYVPLIPLTTVSEVKAPANSNKILTTTYFKDGNNQTYASFTKDNVSGKRILQISDPKPGNIEKSYLPFPALGHISRDDLQYRQNQYYLTTFPDESSAGNSNGASVTVLTSDATKRSHKVMAPGSQFAGNEVGIETEKVTNIANQIRIWNVDNVSGAITSPGFYKASQLFGEKTTGQHGAQTYTFTDKSGNLLYKVQGSLSGDSSLVTQYLYDDFGRLRYTLSPKAVKAISGSSIAPAVLEQLCFTYNYDQKSRLAAERKPGETGFSEYVYDRKGRMVMKRSPLEADKGLWEVVFYDRQGRIKSTALLSNNQSQSHWQFQLDNTAYTATFATDQILYYLSTSAGEAVYPKAAITGLTYLTYSYYDNYDSLSGTFDYSAGYFAEETLAGVESLARLEFPHGLPTYSETRVLKDAITDTDLVDWQSGFSCYDIKGRVIYSSSRNATRNGTTQGYGKTATKYDFAGRTLLTKSESHNAISGTTVIEYYKNQYYTGSGRLHQSWHKIGSVSAPWIVQQTLLYDDLGRVSREVLGNAGEVRDYRYNIRGQLLSVNGTYALTGNKEGHNRTFGEVLEYEHSDVSLRRLDGRIASMTWRGSGGNKMRYRYSYDYFGRLHKADFAEYREGSWTKSFLDYTVDLLSYDPNGNIARMRQYGLGLVDTHMQPVVMDYMDYTYAANSNRLIAVSDSVLTDYPLGDFKDGNTSGHDYSYDPSGNLTEDKNKDIVHIDYNHFNKPVEIQFAGGSGIRYIYDAGGSKLREIVSDPVTGTYKRDYVANAVYKNDTLRYLSTATGRSIYKPVTNKYEEEYFVKDHIGNIRSIIAVESTPFTMEYLATYELFSAYIEGLFFDKVEEVRDLKPGGSPDNQYSGRLIAPESAVGTSLMLRVMAGDQIELEVGNMYNVNTTDTAPISEAALFQSVLSVMMQEPGGLPGENGSVQLLSQLFSGDNMTKIANLMDVSMDDSRPAAALNYLLFNTKNELNTSGSGILQVNGAGAWGLIGTETPITIAESGYLGVFLTSRSTHTPVFFDDLRIRITRGVLREETHYYPHGLPMGYMGTAAAGSVENRQKHQGNEYITDAGLHWMDFQFRQYDPQIGRFLSVDPLADYYGQDRYSPYAAMGNQPESMVDPNGLAFGGSMASISRAADYGEQGGFSADQSIWGQSAIWQQGDQGAYARGVGELIGGGGAGSWSDNSGALYSLNGEAAQNFFSSLKAAFSPNCESQSGEEVPNPNSSGQGSNTGKVDVFFKKRPKQSISIQDLSLCVPTSMEHAGKELKGVGRTKEEITAYASFSLQYDIFVHGVTGSDIEAVAKMFFDVAPFTTYEDAINAGQPVIAAYPMANGAGHAVLVIGYENTTGNLIYLNSLNGSLERRPQTDFYTAIHVPLIKNK